MTPAASLDALCRDIAGRVANDASPEVLAGGDMHSELTHAIARELNHREDDALVVGIADAVMFVLQQRVAELQDRCLGADDWRDGYVAALVDVVGGDGK